MTTRSRLPLLALLLCCLAGPALAVDGVREINQACALNTGCLAGDTAGFPVRINAAGSYRLTSNLYSGDTGGTVLEIVADGVTVDLNGFEIAPCLPGQLCLATGSEGYGVKAVGQTGIKVLNGTVRNMKLQGVLAGDRAQIESIHAALDGGGDQAGLEVGAGSLVIGNVVSGSGSFGIAANDTSSVERNRVQGNGFWGIFAGRGSVVSGNVAFDNVAGGIWVGTGSTVRGNSAYSNDETGIKAAGSCTVRDNTVTDNGGVGLELGGDTGYTENVLAKNATNITGGGPLGTNLCDGVSCNAPPRRRFYLTTESFNGAQADEPETCADGFHFASLWEIRDSSGLQYDTSLGLTTLDSGSGPPNGFRGWIRTGWAIGTRTAPAGTGNCLVWSSSSGGDLGSSAQLSMDWKAYEPMDSEVFPWRGYSSSCAGTRHVWCVQD